MTAVKAHASTVDAELPDLDDGHAPATLQWWETITDGQIDKALLVVVESAHDCAELPNIYVEVVGMLSALDMLELSNGISVTERLAAQYPDDLTQAALHRMAIRRYREHIRGGLSRLDKRIDALVDSGDLIRTSVQRGSSSKIPALLPRF